MKNVWLVMSIDNHNNIDTLYCVCGSLEVAEGMIEELEQYEIEEYGHKSTEWCIEKMSMINRVMSPYHFTEENLMRAIGLQREEYET